MTANASPAKARSAQRRDAGFRMLHIELPDWQVELIDKEAAGLGLPRVAWIRALIAARLRNLPRFSRHDELALFGAYSQARMMREELTSLRRALQEGEADAAVVLARIEDLHRALGRHAAEIRAGFEGNLSYWQGER